jgi:hypothetical protein
MNWAATCSLAQPDRNRTRRGLGTLNQAKVAKPRQSGCQLALALGAGDAQQVNGMMPSARLRAVLIVSALIALITSSCDPLGMPYKDAAGVGVDEQGNTIGHIQLCPGEKVTSIMVGPSDPSTPPATVTAVWAVDSAEGVPLPSFKIGAALEGFRTLTPLREPLDRNTPYVLVVETDIPPHEGTAPIADIPFSVGKLRMGQVLTFYGKYVTPEAFHATTPNKCGG